MAANSASSSHSKDSSLDSPASAALPDAKAARDPQGHFTQAFKLAAIGYANTCGKSQRAAARDTGISDKTLSAWINDARPDATGNIDVQRFDELAQLRTQVRELLACKTRLTAERDFLKKAAAYFATPNSGGSK